VARGLVAGLRVPSSCVPKFLFAEPGEATGFDYVGGIDLATVSEHIVMTEPLGRITVRVILCRILSGE
jgi:hypothetical protein